MRKRMKVSKSYSKKVFRKTAKAKRSALAPYPNMRGGRRR